MWGKTRKGVPDTNPPAQKNSDNPGNANPALYKGRIRRYFADIWLGIIELPDGEWYAFHLNQWPNSASAPVVNQIVLFEPKGTQAVNIKLADSSESEINLSTQS